MPSQQIIEGGSTQREPEQEGIVVPVDVGAFRILKQHLQADGSIEVEVIATTERAHCPHCQRVSVKVHDTRPRRKRDLPLRGHRLVLILQKRRFRCLSCRRSFTEPDQACLEEVAHSELAKRNLSLDETAPLPTPRYLDIDEFARRQGPPYDTILCDLDARQVLEVSAGRTTDEVSQLLDRLSNCDAVEAVSMDMSTTFREAVHLTLPHARIVADHFQVMQHGGLALKKVIGRHAKKETDKQALEGQRHLFLRTQEDLSAEEEQTRAALALAFPEIARAWQLKEALRTWYATTSAATAARDLDRWIASVKGDGPAELRKALSAFRHWRQEMLVFFD